MKRGSRILSILLSLVLVLSMTSVPAFAEDTADDTIPYYITKTVKNGVEYLVFDSAEDIVWLRDLINSQETDDAAAAYYCSYNIILAQNIDMKDYNTPTTGIGSGKKWSGYSGIFDGNGYTISNVEVTGAMAGPKALLFNLTKDATIRNLTIQGTVTADRFIGGVVGRALGSLTLENVVVNATLTLRDGMRNAVGGLIGQVGSGKTVGGDTISIKNCAAFGTYTSDTSTNPVGGLVGYIYGGFDVDIENSYSAADLSCEGGTVAGLIAGQGTANLTITNCYYLDTPKMDPLAILNVEAEEDPADDNPVGPEDVAEQAHAVSADDMQSAAFAANLGSDFLWDGNGYPLPGVTEGAVARIGRTEYAILAEAIAAAEPGETVTLLADIMADIVTPAGADITLELNGKTLTGIDPTMCTVINQGALTIQDSVGGGGITAPNIAVLTTGRLIITGGSITASGVAIQNNGGTVTISGDNTRIISAALYSRLGGTMTIAGGTFSEDVTDYLADGYKVVDNHDGTYTVISRYIIAVTDPEGTENRYETLTEAVSAAQTGGTITLLADIAESVAVPADLDITLELNGKTLTGTVTSAGILTIRDSVGGGGITAAGDSSSAVHVTGGTLTVTGGSFTSSSDTIYNEGGTVLIGGDDTTITTTDPWEFCSCVYNFSGSTSITGGIFKGGTYNFLIFAESEGDIQISGGTFSNQYFSGGNTTNYLADGYKAAANGDGTYTVVPRYVASVTSGGTVTKYETLSEAIADAGAGDTITLLQDIPEVDPVILDAGVTLDLNGKGLQVSATFTSFGDVIDSSGGEGGLYISSVLLQSGNSYLPIYDSEQGCYRLFSYQLTSFGTFTVGMENAVQLWFQLLFTNYNAYALLGEGSDSSQLRITLDLTWDGLDDPMSVLFTTDILKKMAAAAETENMSKYGLYVQVTGLNKLPEGTKISGTPKVESTAGVVSTSAPITYPTATNT